MSWGEGMEGACQGRQTEARTLWGKQRRGNVGQKEEMKKPG